MSDDLGAVLLALFIIAAYWWPTIWAAMRHKRNLTAIGILNFWLGWTFLGWVIALVWAAREDV